MTSAPTGRSREIRRLLRFGLTGGLNTAIDWLVFGLLINLAGWPPAFGQTAGYLCGTANSWLLNSQWVFGVRADKAASTAAAKRTGPPLLRFLVATGLTTAITSQAIHFGLEAAKACRFAALPETWLVWGLKLAVTGLGMACNYSLYRFWVFRRA